MKKYINTYNRLAGTLLKQCAKEEKENVIISPFSIIMLLAIAADACSGKTKNEIANVLSESMPFEEARDILCDIQKLLEDKKTFSSANALCVHYAIEKHILPDYRTNLQNRFNGEFFASENLVQDVNIWTKEKTNGLIPQIMNEPISDETVACLLNAVSFKSDWYTEFDEKLILPERFTNLDNLVKEIPMLHSTEKYYIEDNYFTGFVKPYQEDYSFMALFDDTDWQYPNIVVDEGQDISDAMLEHLSFLAELNDGSFYVFYDRNQFILERNSPEQPKYLDTKAECRLVLYHNCRNTAEIAASVGSLVDMRQEPYVNNVHGEKPKAVFYNDKAAARGIAERFVKAMQENRVALEDMVILSVHSLEHSALHAVTELAGIPVSNTLEEGKVWVTTTRKYKGLEAKAVLLVDVEVSKLTDAVMQRMIYIGGSRANTYLKVAFYEDVEKGDYRGIVDALQEQMKNHCKDAPESEADADINLPGVTEAKLPGTRKSVVKLLRMENATEELKRHRV